MDNTQNKKRLKNSTLMMTNQFSNHIPMYENGTVAYIVPYYKNTDSSRTKFWAIDFSATEPLMLNFGGKPFTSTEEAIHHGQLKGILKFHIDAGGIGTRALRAKGNPRGQARSTVKAMGRLF